MGSWLRIKEWGLFPVDKPPAVEQGLHLASQACRAGLRRGGRRWVRVRLLPVMDPFWGERGLLVGGWVSLKLSQIETSSSCLLGADTSPFGSKAIQQHVPAAPASARRGAEDVPNP